MTKFLLVALLMMGSVQAHAELETDRIAGECAGLMTVQKKMAAAENALSMADNMDRSVKLALAWMDKLKKYTDNKTMIEGMVFAAVGDCRKIGIRSSDYAK